MHQTTHIVSINKKRKNLKVATKPINKNKKPANSLLSLLPELSQTTISRAIKGLYKDRVAPVVNYTGTILASCTNILDPKEKEKFLSKWGNFGGIYMIQLKDHPSIFYIGRTTNFRSRFNAHIRSKNKDKFHLFGRLLGWGNFNVYILKLAPKSEQGKLENFYLQKYLPLLNSAYVSYGSETSITQRLSDLLEARKAAGGKVLKSPGISIAIWAYKLYDTYIDKIPAAKYASVNQASNATSSDRTTLRNYINTSVPFKGFLYFSKPITEFELTFNKAKEAMAKFKLNPSAPKKVWAYDAKTLELIEGKPFDSVGGR